MVSLPGECPSDVGLCNVGAGRSHRSDTDRPWIVVIEGDDVSAAQGSSGSSCLLQPQCQQ